MEELLAIKVKPRNGGDIDYQVEKEKCLHYQESLGMQTKDFYTSI